MARPAGVAKATKDNSNKHPHIREEFTKGKKLGRPKQRWVSAVWYAGTLRELGHWEKVQ
jgi:hypothetical protein